MQSIRTLVLGLMMVAVLTGSVLGQDADKKKKKKDAPQPQAITQAMKKVEAVGLTDEQSAKLKTITAEFAPKFAALNSKLSLTPEQKKAKQEAQAKAKADGLKGKDAAAAVAAAVKLTDEQQKVEQEVKDGLKKLSGELNTAVMALLTPEQKEKLPGKKKAA